MHGQDPTPWSRPSIREVHEVLKGIAHTDEPIVRTPERLVLTVPAEIVTERGNKVPSMTRDLSFGGIGLLHRGAISPGDVTVNLSADATKCSFALELLWCAPCENGLFMSGGRFRNESESKDSLDE